MRINTIESRGLRVWPPKGVFSQSINDKAVLTGVKIIVATNFLRVDFEHNMIPDLGMIVMEMGDLKSLYRKLKENIGRSLAEIGELDIDFEHDQEEEGLIRATMGR
jgi:hypothetical protein